VRDEEAFAMASAAERRRYTPEEYLALERQAPFKSEYDKGEIFAMSGVSREHNLITGAVYRAISSRLEGRPRETFVADMRIKRLSHGPLHVPGRGRRLR
jgi:Uma2 family endonuclease